MYNRRKISRDVVSFGRRTPRFDLVALRTDVALLTAMAPSRPAEVIELRIAARRGRTRTSPARTLS